MRFSLIHPRRISFKLKKYLYIANDITSMMLNKEKAKEDKRVKNLTLALIIAIIVLVTSLAVNVYFATGV